MINHVFISFSSGTVSDEVVLHGPKEDVSKARGLLLEMAAQHAIENYTEELKCRPEYHKFLIGKGGSKIRKIRSQFNARVLFPQRGSGDDISIITIIGVKENVLSVKEHLSKQIKDLVSDECTYYHYVTDCVSLFLDYISWGKVSFGIVLGN